MTRISWFTVTMAAAASVGLASLKAHGAAPVVMYDAGQGTVPTSQGWAFVATPFGQANATQKFANGVATIDSTAVRTDKAGWFSNLPPFGVHPTQPPMDADAGFVLSFVARLGAEEHATPDRAGFSVIATASNLSAIELGFWADEIWAQSGADFKHAEGAAFGTTAGLVRYDLEVKGARYRLSANGALVLQGDLRRYDSFGTPYNVPEFLFLGDDTTSAQASADLARVTLGALPRVAIASGAGGFTLSAEADTGREVVFESSPDFTTWTTAGTATGAAGVAKLEVPIGAGPRFFRAFLR